MLVVTALCLFISICDAKILEPYSINENNNITSCVQNIMPKFFQMRTGLTIVQTQNGINEDMEDVVEAVHKMNIFSIIYEKPYSHQLLNKGYLLLAENCKAVLQRMILLRKNRMFPASSRFIILLKNYEQYYIKKIFDELLNLRLYGVIIVDIIDGRIVSYNPFVNGSCGRKYDRIIDLGYCNEPYNEFYPNFRHIEYQSLRNCTFRVLAPHYPPYAINANPDGIIGTEQFTLAMLSKAEGFKVNYTYEDIAEEYSDVSSNMSVSGPMSYLQSNKYDIVIGSLILNVKRASAFEYMYGHLAYTDEFAVFVPKAKIAPKWKRVYLEFDSIVWFLILCSFITYAIISVALVIKEQNEDQMAKVILKLYDNLLSHPGNNVRSGYVVKCIIIHWIFFTFLINSYYQTSLMSLTTRPSYEYQVQNRVDLVRSNYVHCASGIIKAVLESSDDVILKNINRSKCETVLGSLSEVSKSKNLFALAQLSVYHCRKYLFMDDKGNSLLYKFKHPYNKIMTAIYFYKGFPLVQRLNRRGLEMREQGLMQYSWNRVTNYYILKHQSKMKKSVDCFEDVINLSDLQLPFLLLFLGSFLSTLVFIIEISTQKIFLE